MAFTRFTVKARKVGYASSHSDYIFGQGEYIGKFTEVESMSNMDKFNLYFKEKYEVCERLGSGNLPAEFDNFDEFWKSADENERANGTTYIEHVINLPVELDKEQRIELVEGWISQEVGGNDFPFSYAIHNVIRPNAEEKKGTSDSRKDSVLNVIFSSEEDKEEGNRKKKYKEQPHLHLMFSERKNDGIERKKGLFFKRHNPKKLGKGGSKKINSGKTKIAMKIELEEQRLRWEKMCNKHLLKAGKVADISMLSDSTRGRHKYYEKINQMTSESKLDFDVEKELNRVRAENDKRDITTSKRAIESGNIATGGAEQLIADSKHAIAGRQLERADTDTEIETTERAIAESEQRLANKRQRGGIVGQWSNSTTKRLGRSKHRVEQTEQRVADTQQRTTASERILAEEQKAREIVEDKRLEIQQPSPKIIPSKISEEVATVTEEPKIRRPRPKF